MRKSILKLQLVIFLIFIATMYTYGHSGNTNSEGGHHNHETGEYHYHHGRGEHQHYQEHCPYDAEKEMYKLSLLSGLVSFLFFKAKDKTT